jgi:hypothetical protein
MVESLCISDTTLTDCPTATSTVALSTPPGGPLEQVPTRVAEAVMGLLPGPNMVRWPARGA